MRTNRGLERLIFFTDAVTAIAITLLILPLVDAVPDVASRSDSVAEFFSGRGVQLLGFIVSFTIIARLWAAHHALFEHVRAYDSRMMVLNLGWAFSIVLLPLPTAIIFEFSSDRLTVAVYIGTMATSSLILTAIAWFVHTTPALEFPENPLPMSRLIASFVTSGAFLLALVIGVLSPSINYFALLVLALSSPVERLIERRATRQSSSATSRHD